MKEIDIKELADKIKSIGFDKDSFDPENFDPKAFEESGFAELFGRILCEKLDEPYEPATEEELYEEIVDNFFSLIQELGIEHFDFFRFVNYDYCREIIIDGKEYDLDIEFCHDDQDASEALCAIDCLIADMESNNYTATLKKIETMINVRNKE